MEIPAYILNIDRPIGATARTPCEIAYFSKTEMERITREVPEVWASLAKLTAGHIQLLMSIIACNAERDPQTRVSLTLLRLLGDGLIFGWGGEDDPRELPLNQNELAEMSLLSRNSVGTVLKKLETKGAIAVGYRSVRILDRDLLRPPT